ncbi:MAG: SLBB domain-containing protein [Flavobacteriaceae bacterium]|nr:SLBB domain-containing protein [Flavobacteriaceae bacterium]
MKYWILVLILTFSIFSTQIIVAQDIDKNQISKVDIDKLSDEQIASYWEKAKKEGYTLDQLEIIAKSKGMSTSQFLKLKKRINELKNENIKPNKNNLSDKENKIPEIRDDSEEILLEKFGLKGNNFEKKSKNLLFGFDFFNNSNISFTPNMNLATPANYQVGPGDEFLIDIWGASENNYKKIVDREGSIRIENIGPIYVSGLAIDKAKEKIISYLRKIYSGIGAPNTSYSKVFANVSLVGVRTVQVNIIGEVKTPGTYSINALSTVLNALYAAGGPTENGTFRNIKIIRSGLPYEEFDIYKYLIEGSEKGNVTLQDQDIIIVQPYLSKIEVVGNVKRPGFYEMKQDETIDNLIRFFGGFTASAYHERIIVERANGKQKTVSEIVLEENRNFQLKDGDKITIGEIIDRYENRVSIGGAIYRPGTYELSKDLTLSKLIEKASGIKDEAFLDRGIIYRTLEGIKLELVPFSVKNILDKTADVILKREDSIHIFDKKDLKEKYTISIDGAINKPQTIDYIEKMRIEDLIAIAGGYKEGADVEVIDISRRISDGKFIKISKNIRKSSSSNLIINEKDNFYLEPFDIVSVRYVKGYSIQKNVTIEGEVNYPGNYSISDKNERISDLVKKSGGFSPYAYLKGATLTRKVANTTEKTQLKILYNLIEKDSIAKDKKDKTEEKDIKKGLDLDETDFKIGIDLDLIMKVAGTKSKYDLILNEGDVLNIPSEKQTVEIRGEILSPSLIRFDKNNSFRDYINNSGGFSDNAKKRKAYVIYANGDIRSAKNFLFFISYPKIEPGALILVPQKPENNSKMTFQEIIGLTSLISTLGILINTLVVK